MKLSEKECQTLQVTLARDTPALVLGPGCHRVGYDEGDPWAEVVRRIRLVWAQIDDTAEFVDGAVEAAAAVSQPRVFLEHLFASKISAKNRDEHGVPAMPGTAKPETWTDIDGPRSVLGASLLGVLYECTRCLGNVIATGASPVTNWLAVSHPGPTGSGVATAEGEPAYDAAEADQARERAALHLVAAVEIACYLEEWTKSAGGLGRRQQAVGDQRGFGDLPPADEIKKTLNLLKIEAVFQRLDYLQRHCFKSRTMRLTGALIEWLADLFWHLMVTDSGVPPSQAELAFYINLRADELSAESAESAFRRAGAGEVRGLEPDILTDDISRLLKTYDSGIAERQDKGSPRDELATMVSACTLELWEQRDRHQVIVLSSDFDLSFERTLLEMSAPGDAIHLVIPVWLTMRNVDHPVLEWLFTTVKRTKGSVRGQQLIKPGSWRLYGELPGRDDDDDPVEGPIVVKLNGSPLVRLEARPEGLRLGEGESVEIATIFNEYDSLHAIISFAGAGNDKSGLASGLIADLQWNVRSWIVLGDSFPHWLPRVRLIYSARSLFGKSTPKNPTKPQHIAIDRAFGWPEKPLLDALGIASYEEDLADFPGLLRRSTPADDEDDVQLYLANVLQRLEDHHTRESARGGR